jgi:dipeptidyl aminopeptidase/acylaminoacyl peptidase
VRGLTVLPGDSEVLTVDEQAVHEWSVATGRELRKWPPSAQERGERIALLGSASVIVVDGWARDLRHVDLETGEELWQAEHPEGVGVSTLSPDSSLFAVGDGEGGVAVYDTRSGELRCRLNDVKGTSGRVPLLAISPDNSTLAAGVSGESSVGEVWLWDVPSGRLIHRLQPMFPNDSIASLAFSPDGRSIAATDGFGFSTIVWEVTTGRPRLELADSPDHSDSAERVAFSHDGRFLVGLGYGAIRFWDLSTGKKCKELSGHDGEITSVAFTHDGRRMITGSADTTALVWDLARLNLPGPLPEVARTPAQLDALWDHLRGEDAVKARAAVWELVGSGRGGVAFLSGRVRPAPVIDPPEVGRLIAALDADDFATRQKAGDRLAHLGQRAAPLVRQALARKASAEVRRHLEGQLREWGDGRPVGEILAGLRAVEALEHLGTTEARRLLAELAKGVPDAELTRQAKASLERLSRRAP